MAARVSDINLFLDALQSLIEGSALLLGNFVTVGDDTLSCVKFDFDYSSLTREQQVRLHRLTDRLNKIDVAYQNLFEALFFIVQKPWYEKKKIEYESKISV